MDDAQRARFEAAFQTPWVDKVTKRKRTLRNPGWITFGQGQGDCFPDAVCWTRVEEVERLTLEDVELRPKSGVLHIRQGKGFRERDVPLPKPAREPLEAWLKEREKQGISHEALFVDLRAGGRRLSRRSMQNMVAQAGQRAGLDRLDPPVKVTPHVLASYICLHVAPGRGEPQVRAEMSGHSIEAAMKYGRPKAREKERAADALDEFV